MQKPVSVLVCLAVWGTDAVCHAGDFKTSRVTQVVNDVRIISAARQSEKAAVTNDLFAMPDVLQTGTASRAELVSQDDTVTRVGANTIFSFDPANRTVNLKQGSLLFHSPHGQGGGSIRTGSATASVLGSTLIVTTTSKGGFKVLALEDDAVVRLPNGRKLKLHPGQMTFVLPGGDELSPIITFRLDSLTQGSLLLKGFALPLTSWSLIQTEIDKQTKLIKAGLATDTGLDVGNNANGNQVEVLDLNSMGHHYNNSAQVALGANATVNQASLTDVSLPTPPNHVFVAQPFKLTGNTYFGLKSFTGFAARNLNFNTGGTGARTLGVDLSPYAGRSEFDFVTAGNLNFLGSVTFHGLSVKNSLYLYGGNQIQFASGVAVQADCGDFEILAPKAALLDAVQLKNALGQINLDCNDGVTIQNGSVLNARGNLNLSSVGDVSLTGSSATGASLYFFTLAGAMTLDSSTLTAPGHVILATTTDLNLQNSSIDSGVIILGAGLVSQVNIDHCDLTATGDTLEIVYARNNCTVQNSTLQSAGTLEVDAGSITVQNTSLTAKYLTLNSGDGILLDANGKALTAVGTGSIAKFTAPNLVTVNNADFSSFGQTIIAANTLVLNNVAFGDGQVVTLKSQYGQLAPNANTGQAALSGYVNFINNVTYGGNPAQDYVNNGSSTHGITITTLH